MPPAERLMKDANHLLWQIRSFFTYGRVRTLLIHPHYPSRKATIYRIARELSLQVTNHLSNKAELAIFYEYSTYKEEYQVLEKFAASGLRVLNLHSRSIGKFHVDNIHQEVFGYATRIDPTQYQGLCVKKSDVNALHDGTIIQCPIGQVEEGFIYQMLIDNKNDKGLFEDIRVAVVGNELPIAYLKSRKPAEQFGHRSRAELVDVHHVLSETEISQVKAFVIKSKLEYAEIDILRHRGDGRIYIIDVNDTPQSARDNLSRDLLQDNIRTLATSFKRQYL